ncbi:MAG: zeta toxin family protein [Treponema sp.]|nr:zeta toxin family protein [Treponema sp.]
MTKKTKKIICLQGSPNTGKSYTIITLWKLILEKYKNDKDDDYVQFYADTDNYDFVGIITSVNGHKIGINSRGDDPRWIERWNKKLADNNCDIIFCACHSYGKTEEAVIDFAKNGYEVEFIKKDTEESDSEKKQKTMNKTQAKELLETAGL